MTTTLNFAKATQGTTLNFSKDLGVDMSNVNIVLNVNWTANLSVDLDSCLALVSGESSGSKPGFLSKLFGAKSDSSNVKAFVHTFDRRCGDNDGVKFHGDDLTGGWASGEFIEIDTSKLGDDVTEIIPSVLAYSNVALNSLDSAGMRVYIGTPTKVVKPLFEVDLTDMSSSVRGAQFGKLVKNSAGEWEWITDIKYTNTSGSSGFRKLKDIAGQ